MKDLIKKQEEYNKTWYYKYTLPRTIPKNWIVGTPIKVFGKVILVKWKIAKANYKWSKIN